MRRVENEVAAAGVHVMPKRDGHDNPPRRSVLAVDDDARVLTVTCRLLERMGHRVLGAEDGAAALALIRAERVDLVLCDVDMPIMPGPALHNVLLTERPDLAGRFAFCTGGPLVDLPSGVPVLIKPVDEEALRETLHTLAESGYADG
jgi:CheY-like chemotaxis protein